MITAFYAETHQNTDQPVTDTNVRLGQTFRYGRESVVGRCSLYMKSVGTPAGFVYVEIWTDIAGATPSKLATSLPILSSDLLPAYTWVEFKFNNVARPALTADTTYTIVLMAAGYTYAAGTSEIVWGSDGVEPIYTDGAAYAYTTAWAPIADNDFIFELATGYRPSYIGIADVEGIVREQTSSGKFTATSNPTAEKVYDFIDDVCNEIDGWLQTYNIITPLTLDAAIDIVKPYAIYGTAMLVELSQSTGGFRAESTTTRSGSFRDLYYGLKKSLKDGLANAIINTGQPINSDNLTGRGLTAGGVESAEQAEQQADSSLIQPNFKIGMWDNV